MYYNLADLIQDAALERKKGRILDFVNDYVKRLQDSLDSATPAEQPILKAHGRLRFEFTFTIKYRPDFITWGKKQALAIMLSGFGEALALKKVRT